MIISARVRAFGRCSSSSIWKRSIPLTRRSVSLRSLARSHCYNNSIGIVRHSSASQLLSLRGIHHHRSTPISKVCSDAKTALELSGLKNGDTVAVGKNSLCKNQLLFHHDSLDQMHLLLLSRWIWDGWYSW